MVVSEGIDELPKFRGKQVWHFPQNEDGEYGGSRPADSTAAINHLEALRIRGGNFLLFPNRAFWWLDHYREFRQHLDTWHRCIWNDEHCTIYELLDEEERSILLVENVEKVRVRIKEGEWKQALKRILMLLRYYPRGTTLLLLNKWRIEHKLGMKREHDTERHRLARRLQARREELEVRERRLKELEGAQEESEGTSLAKERQEVQQLRRRVRRLKRRMQNLSLWARIGQNGKSRRLLERLGRVRAKVSRR